MLSHLTLDQNNDYLTKGYLKDLKEFIRHNHLHLEYKSYDSYVDKEEKIQADSYWISNKFYPYVLFTIIKQYKYNLKNSITKEHFILNHDSISKKMGEEIWEFCENIQNGNFYDPLKEIINALHKNSDNKNN